MNYIYVIYVYVLYLTKMIRLQTLYKKGECGKICSLFDSSHYFENIKTQSAKQ